MRPYLCLFSRKFKIFSIMSRFLLLTCFKIVQTCVMYGQKEHTSVRKVRFHCGNFHENQKRSTYFSFCTPLVQEVIQIGRKCRELEQNFIHALIKSMTITGQIFMKNIICSTALSADLYQFLSTSEEYCRRCLQILIYANQKRMFLITSIFTKFAVT